MKHLVSLAPALPLSCLTTVGQGGSELKSAGAEEWLQGLEAGNPTTGNADADAEFAGAT